MWLYAFVEVGPKPTKFELRKSDKINLRIRAKRNSHLQTLTKLKDSSKIVGGVAFTRYPVYLCFKSMRAKQFCVLTTTESRATIWRQ